MLNRIDEFFKMAKKQDCERPTDYSSLLPCDTEAYDKDRDFIKDFLFNFQTAIDNVK